MIICVPQSGLSAAEPGLLWSPQAKSEFFLQGSAAGKSNGTPTRPALSCLKMALLLSSIACYAADPGRFQSLWLDLEWSEVKTCFASWDVLVLCSGHWVLRKLTRAWKLAGSQGVPGVVFSGWGIIVHDRVEQQAGLPASSQIDDTVSPQELRGNWSNEEELGPLSLGTRLKNTHCAISHNKTVEKS